eukprot:UN11705
MEPRMVNGMKLNAQCQSEVTRSSWRQFKILTFLSLVSKFTLLS